MRDLKDTFDITEITASELSTKELDKKKIKKVTEINVTMKLDLQSEWGME
jgi:hypothetical protein